MEEAKVHAAYTRALGLMWYVGAPRGVRGGMLHAGRSTKDAPRKLLYEGYSTGGAPHGSLHEGWSQIFLY